MRVVGSQIRFCARFRAPPAFSFGVRSARPRLGEPFGPRVVPCLRHDAYHAKPPRAEGGPESLSGIAMTEHAEQRLCFKLIRRRTKHAQRSKTYPSRPDRRHEGAPAAAYRQPRQTRSRAGWERSAWGNSAWRREYRTGSFGPARYESPTKKVIPHSCAASGTSGLEPHCPKPKADTLSDAGDHAVLARR